MKLIQIMAGLNSKRFDYASPMSRDTFHPCHYARSMKANLLDDGIGGTLVSPAFDDVNQNRKRVNPCTRIERNCIKTDKCPVHVFTPSALRRDEKDRS